MLRSMLVVAAIVISFTGTTAEAAIYTCTRADGTRVFSDKACETDSQIVDPAGKPTSPKSTSSEAATAAKATAADPATAPVSASELEPDRLRPGAEESEEQFRQRLKRACDRGSTKECEELYCRGGINEQCRTALTDAGALVGAHWYKRQRSPVMAPAAKAYAHFITCDPKNQVIKDYAVYCTGDNPPTDCRTQIDAKKFPTLTAAADYICSRQR